MINVTEKPIPFRAEGTIISQPPSHGEGLSFFDEWTTGIGRTRGGFSEGTPRVWPLHV